MQDVKCYKKIDTLIGFLPWCLIFGDVCCTALSQEDLCADETFTYLVGLVTVHDISRKTNAVVYLLTAVIQNNGT